MPKITEQKAKEQLREIDELYGDALSSVQGRLDFIKENLSFYVGMQHAVQDGVYVDLYDSPTGEAIEMYNICRPIIRAGVAATLKQRINPEIASLTGDFKARARADMSERLCRAWERNGVIDYDELHTLVSWSKITGLGWMKVCWDPDAGRPVETAPIFEVEELAPDQIEDEMEDDGFGNYVAEQIFEGEIVTEFVKSTELLPDPTATSWRELRQPGSYVVHRKLRPVRFLEDSFPVDMFGKKSRGRWEIGRKVGDKDFDSTMDAYSNPDGKYSDSNVMAELCEFWQNPTRRFPNGRLCIFSGTGLIIYLGPNPYTHRRIPFVPLFGDNKIPGSLNPDGALADIKSTQRTINRIEAKKREMLDFAINPRIYVPRSSGIDPDSFDDLPKVIPYDKGFKPEIEQPPPIPDSLFTYGETLVNSAQHTSGYGGSSADGVPANASSGRALAYQRENEESIHAPEMLSYRLFLTEVLQLALQTAKQFYDDGRVIKIMGDEGKWELMEFSRDDYDLDAELIPEVFSGLPNSPAERFAEVTELYGLGLFDPMNPGAQVALKLLGERYASASTFDERFAAKQKAKRLITTVTRDPSKPVNIYPWDDHNTLLEELNKYRSSVSYEELPDMLRMKIDALAELSEQFLADQNMVLAQDQQLLNSGGQSAPPGSPPVQPQAESPGDGGWASPGQEQQAQEPPQQQVVQQDLGQFAGNDSMPG